jgi:CheY-like chemotaxis protein
VPDEPPPRSGPGVDAVVLVVDDDDDVRDVTRRMLESEGFGVTTAASGAEVLRRVARGEPVDLVLLDLSMPGMSGLEVRRGLAAVAPALPVVFLTGAAHLAPGDGAILYKPVTHDQLVRCVRAALGRTSPR